MNIETIGKKLEIIQDLKIIEIILRLLYILAKCNQSSIVMSSINIHTAWSFLLFLTTEDLEPKYAIKTWQELNLQCKKSLTFKIITPDIFIIINSVFPAEIIFH